MQALKRLRSMEILHSRIDKKGGTLNPPSGKPLLRWKKGFSTESKAYTGEAEGDKPFFKERMYRSGKAIKRGLRFKLKCILDITAMVYIMTDKVMDRIHLNFLNKSYLDTVREGYWFIGFDEKFIEDAFKVSEKAIKKVQLSYI